MTDHRDTGEQSTRRDVLDFDGIAPADDGSHYRDNSPQATVDHGRQPRKPKPPTEVIYGNFGSS